MIQFPSKGDGEDFGIGIANIRFLGVMGPNAKHCRGPSTPEGGGPTNQGEQQWWGLWQRHHCWLLWWGCVISIDLDPGQAGGGPSNSNAPRFHSGASAAEHATSSAHPAIWSSSRPGDQFGRIDYIALRLALATAPVWPQHTFPWGGDEEDTPALHTNDYLLEKIIIVITSCQASLRSSPHEAVQVLVASKPQARWRERACAVSCLRTVPGWVEGNVVSYPGSPSNVTRPKESRAITWARLAAQSEVRPA